MKAVYTIGHSTRPIEEFIDLLKNNRVEQLVDVRTIPRSRHNPQYEQTALEISLPKSGIEYKYMKDLGGLRPAVKNSVNQGWQNQSFRNYADYMQTAEFKKALNKLIKSAKAKTTAIMCAEAVPWRCHRSLIADALIAKNILVKEIISSASPREHKLKAFAKVANDGVIYPKN